MSDNDVTREKADDARKAGAIRAKSRHISDKGTPALADDRGMPPQLVGWGILVGLILIASGSSILIFVARVGNVGGLMACKASTRAIRSATTRDVPPAPAAHR
jgi:hypothetical protein